MKHLETSLRIGKMTRVIRCKVFSCGVYVYCEDTPDCRDWSFHTISRNFSITKN